MPVIPARVDNRVAGQTSGIDAGPDSSTPTCPADGSVSAIPGPLGPGRLLRSIDGVVADFRKEHPLVPVSRFPVGGFDAPLILKGIPLAKVSVFGSAPAAGVRLNVIRAAVSEAAQKWPDTSVFVTSDGAVFIGRPTTGAVRALKFFTTQAECR